MPSALRKITPEDRLYFEIKQLRSRLDMLIREYEDSLPADRKAAPRKAVAVIDPRTQRPFGAGKGAS